MPKAAFATLGCKVNQYETQRILDSFEVAGFEITEFNCVADIYVINSCSVTQTAERKSRQMIRRLQRQNPDALIVLTGCYGEMASNRMEMPNEVALHVPNPEKMRTLEIFLNRFPDLRPSQEIHKVSTQAMKRKSSRTRAMIKVQDGCDLFCSYCSIPYTRNRMLSRPFEEIIKEAEDLAEKGYREIVVTGVLVGSYRDCKDALPRDLADLLRALANINGIERVRLSSIEPTQVTDKLLRTFKEEQRLCNHLHIPLQSGDSGILRSMNRPYDRDYYLTLCERAYHYLPNAAITTDILTGFPGENEEAFRNTMDVVRKAHFARAHIFRYSARPGTPAAQMQDTVSEKIKEERSHRLAALCKEVQNRYISKFIGESMSVLVEGKETQGGLLSGYTENYIRTLFTGGTYLIGKVIPIKLISSTEEGALAETLNSFQPEADIIPLSLVKGTRIQNEKLCYNAIK